MAARFLSREAARALCGIEQVCRYSAGSVWGSSANYFCPSLPRGRLLYNKLPVSLSRSKRNRVRETSYLQRGRFLQWQLILQGSASGALFGARVLSTPSSSSLASMVARRGLVCNLAALFTWAFTLLKRLDPDEFHLLIIVTSL